MKSHICDYQKIIVIVEKRKKLKSKVELTKQNLFL